MTSLDENRLELFERTLCTKGLARRSDDALQRRASLGDAPLAFEQVRLWFLDQYEPGNPRYNDCVALSIEGVELDAERLEAAVSRVVERHDSLRTWFVTCPSGRPVQRVRASIRVPFRVVDLRDEASGYRDLRLAELTREEARRPFYLDQAPLFRVVLFRLTDTTNELVLTTHQIVSPPADLPLQYADFARWEREAVSESGIQRDLGYWREHLDGLPRLKLPLDRPRPERTSGRGAVVARHLPPDLARTVAEFGRAHGVTSYAVFLAAYSALLGDVTGQSDFAVGSPTSCRSRVELEGLIGYFLQTKLLRADLTGDPTFTDLVERAWSSSLAAQRRRRAPFNRVVQVVRRAGPFGEPLIQAWFGHMRDLIRAPRFQGPEGGEEAHTSVHLVDVGKARYELSLIVEEHPDGTIAHFEYDLELFDTARVEAWATRFVALLQAGIASPLTPLSGLTAAAGGAVRPTISHEEAA